MFDKREWLILITSSIVFTAMVMFSTSTIVAAFRPEVDQFCTHRELPADLDVRTW
jgi:hypothetical protein